MNLDILKKLFPRASKSTIEANTHDDNPDPRLQNTELERDKASALGFTIEREKESVGRTRISFIGYRCRPLDPDNFAGSVKDLIDGLRKVGLIKDDSPEHITLITEQVKVAHRGEERTQIVLQYDT